MVSGASRQSAPPIAARAAEPAAPRRSRAERCAVGPGIASFVIVLAVALGFLCWAWQVHDGSVGITGRITTVLWTLPFTSSLIGLTGAVRSYRRLRSWSPAPAPTVRDVALIVVVPTVGRADTFAALERVVRSYSEHLPSRFPRFRTEIVIEEGCPAEEAIHALAGPFVEIVTVPRDYRTAAGTRFKARANHYANVRRIAAGDARDDVWVLHMDDDTGVGADTADELARFVDEQRERGEDGLHLAQGVLTYPREYSARRLLWMADAVRPAQDVSLFATTTGRGTPRAGLHGELLLVRATVEAEIGWDFGPRAVVEDAEFALHFVQRYPGRSGWFPGRSFGATPVCLNDFLKQRERWAWGLLELAGDRNIALRHRLLLMHNMVIWSCSPLQHIGVIVVTGALLGDLDTFPLTPLLLPLWAVNVGFQVWCYWEGITINARASESRQCRLWERMCVVALIPIFSLWESIGFLRGFVRFVRRGDSTFTVIAKPL